MERENKTSYPESIGSGALWLRSGKKGSYLSGYLEFPKDMVPIRVNFFAFPAEDGSMKPDKPSYRIRVMSWDFAPARKIAFREEPHGQKK